MFGVHALTCFPPRFAGGQPPKGGTPNTRKLRNWCGVISEVFLTKISNVLFHAETPLLFNPTEFYKKLLKSKLWAKLVSLWLIIVILAVSAWLIARRCIASACPQTIKIQCGIEQHKKLALGLVSPHWVGGKKDNVTFANGDINDGGLTSEFASTAKHSADEQILFIGGKSQNYSRSQI